MMTGRTAQIVPALSYSFAQWQKPWGPCSGEDSGFQGQLVSVWALLLEDPHCTYVYTCACIPLTDLYPDQTGRGTRWSHWCCLHLNADCSCLCAVEPGVCTVCLHRHVLGVFMPCGITHAGPKDNNLWYPCHQFTTRFTIP